MRGIFLAPFLVAIAASASGCAAATERETPVLRICDIQANKSAFIGKVVTLSADYSTDSSHYAYLRDRTCAKQGILDIGFVVPERDPSVDAFEAKERQLCLKRGTPYLCLLEARVSVTGTIAETVGAHLAPDASYLIINLHSVQSAEFSGER